MLARITVPFIDGEALVGRHAASGRRGDAGALGVVGPARLLRNFTTLGTFRLGFLGAWVVVVVPTV